MPNAPENVTAAPRKISFSQKLKIIAIAIAIALAISAVLAFYVHQNFVVKERLQQMQALTQQRAEHAADNVRSWLHNQHGELLQFTQRPSLGNLLENQNAETVDSQLNQLKNSAEGAVGIQVFKKGQAELDPESYPPIRFSELSMIATAEDGETVAPELARIENEWLVNFVLPITDVESEQVVGTMIATFDVTQLKQILERAFQGKVHMSLLQQVGSAGEVDTLNLGEGNTDITAVVAIPDSWWRIKVEAAPTLASETLVQAPFIYSMLAAITITLVLLAYLAGRFIGGRLEQSGKTISKGIGDLVTPKKESYVDPLYQQKDILDIDIKDKDEALLGLNDEAKPAPATTSKSREAVAEVDEKEKASIPEEIFRAYDIRGLARTQITREVATKIGQAVASEALDNNEHTLIVARDARLHSPELTEYLIRGILKTGCNVLNIGTVPTPVLYFATETLAESRSGIMVTASHNPAEYNGFKIVINGICRAEEDIKAIRARILSKNLHQGEGAEEKRDITSSYVDTIFADVALAGDVRIVVDAGNGVTGLLGPRLLEELGCQVTPLYCDLDGQFPNHDPDPSVPQNLRALIARVKEDRADLGVAYDGDGDRLVVVTASGEVIWPDRLLMLFAKDILSRHPGADVVFDVKSSRHLASIITSYGGRPIMSKTGHSPMKSKMAETGAMLGGEFSGHIFIKDRWYGFDDGLYATARLLEIMTLQGESLDEMMKEFPASLITPEIRVKVKEQYKFMIMDKLRKEGNFGEAKVSNIDGIRAEFKHGWGLIRASNTSPCLTMRFEADDEDAMHKLKSLFVKELRNIDPSIQVDWE